MKYISTRNSAYKVTATQAIVMGLAPDGGLFVPESIPTVDMAFIRSLAELPYWEKAVRVMSLYLDEFSPEELSAIAQKSYADNFDTPAVAPLRFISDDTAVMELWHGPTSAFKDMALQIMPRLLTASLQKNKEERTVCILVATSGDTGKAALEGFRDIPGTKILVFYPKNGVSDVQKLQMCTQKGENVRVVAVEGNFDDAQTGVKAIFSDREFAQKLDKKGYFLSSANSINWGRLLPQVVYYFSAYCDYARSGRISFGEEIDFAVPTGNFGDILAGWYAKRMGLPVRRLLCASNANRILTDFMESGCYNKRRDFYLTDSPSMDILVSSNLERLLFNLTGDSAQTASYMNALSETGAYSVTKELLAAVQSEFTAGCADDARGKGEIARLMAEQGYLVDTHTAVALCALKQYREKTNTVVPTVVLSTASAFKFCGAVLSALGRDKEESGLSMLKSLSECTGYAAPGPLAALEGAEPRFRDYVKPADMPRAVEEFLK